MSQETTEKRIPKVWMGCVQHPDGGSCWVRKGDRTYLWCYECKGAIAFERPTHDFYSTVSLRVEVVKGTDGNWNVDLGANERILNVEHHGSTAWVYIIKEDDL